MLNSSHEIITRLSEEMQALWNIFLQENTSNFLPYHNAYHASCVLKYVTLLATFEKMSDDEKRDLQTAAIFHDFHHSGGLEDDSVNVQTAIDDSALLICANSEYTIEQFNDRIKPLIKATEYPYVIDDEDLSLSQKIMRDADLLQATEPTYYAHVFCGLSAEMGVPPKQLVIGLREWNEKVTMYTKQAKIEWKGAELRIKETLDEIEKFV